MSIRRRAIQARIERKRKGWKEITFTGPPLTAADMERAMAQVAELDKQFPEVRRAFEPGEPGWEEGLQS